MAKSAADLFARFCAEHNIYAVVSFVKGVTIDNVGDQDMSNAMSHSMSSAPREVLKALADGCEQQSLQLDQLERRHQKECDRVIKTSAWFEE